MPLVDPTAERVLGTIDDEQRACGRLAEASNRGGSSLNENTVPCIGLIWPQFSPYHVDRCEAVAARLNSRARVLACEIATSSELYAWAPSGGVEGAQKVTLFPGASYEEIGTFARLRAMFRALRKCHYVFVGVAYSERDIILVSMLLRLFGVKVILMNDSKFDDKPRHVLFELVKAGVLMVYSGAIIAGARQRNYVRFLGFRRRPVMEGYDTVNLDRVRTMANQPQAPDGLSFPDRHFIFVGRFVKKKNILTLIDAYHLYVSRNPAILRKLILVGSGEMEDAIVQRIKERNLTDLVELPGFLQAEGVSSLLAKAVALVLPSSEEQWGLVVNEALAFNLPIIVSDNVGARDSLVRSNVNGYIVEPNNIAGFAQAMYHIGEDETLWRRMCAMSGEISWAAHSDRFAEAVAAVLAFRPRSRADALVLESESG